MGNNYLANPLVFLVDTLFSLYIMVVMLRFLLQWVRADFYNPISQFIVRVTSPLLVPLRRVIPALGKIDTSTLVLMFLLQILSLVIITSIVGITPGIGALAILAVGELIGLALNIFLFAILIQVIISWINPGSHNPATSLLYGLTEPLLSPARRLIPPISGMDLSPLVVMLALQLLKLLILPVFHMAA